MKRAIICACVLLLIIAAILCISLPGEIGLNGEASALPRGDKDLTVLPEFVYNPEAIAGGTVLELVSFQGSGLDDEPAQTVCDTVIEGSVRNIYYTFTDGSAWTQADIYVHKAIEGGLVKGNIISVYFPGGYVSAEDYSVYYGSRTDMDNCFLHFEPPVLPLPEEGDRGTYYLSAVSSASPLPEGAYLIVNAALQ